MGHSLQRPSKRAVYKQINKCHEQSLSQGNTSLERQTPMNNLSKRYPVKLHMELMIEVFKYLPRRRLCELKLINHWFESVCESSARNAVHIISSIEFERRVTTFGSRIPAYEDKANNEVPKGNNDPNPYQKEGGHRLEKLVGFNHKGYPTFSVCEIPPGRHIRFAYVTLRAYGDGRTNRGLAKWLFDHRQCFSGCILDAILISPDCVPYFIDLVNKFDQCSQIILYFNTRVNAHEWTTPINILTTCDVILRCNRIELTHVFSMDTTCIESVISWLHYGGSDCRTLGICEYDFMPDVGILIDRVKTIFMDVTFMENTEIMTNICFQLVINSLKEKEPFSMINESQKLTLSKSKKKPKTAPGDHGNYQSVLERRRV